MKTRTRISFIFGKALKHEVERLVQPPIDKSNYDTAQLSQIVTNSYVKFN